MPISKEDLIHFASLAYLDIPVVSIDGLLHELNGVIRLLEVLSDEDAPDRPGEFLTGIDRAPRKDEATKPLQSRDVLLNASSVSDDFVQVPCVFPFRRDSVSE